MHLRKVHIRAQSAGTLTVEVSRCSIFPVESRNVMTRLRYRRPSYTLVPRTIDNRPFVPSTEETSSTSWRLRLTRSVFFLPIPYVLYRSLLASVLFSFYLPGVYTVHRGGFDIASRRCRAEKRRTASSPSCGHRPRRPRRTTDTLSAIITDDEIAGRGCARGKCNSVTRLAG